MSKSVLWYFHWPGLGANPLDIRFEKPVAEREAREGIREWAKLKRLPNYTKVWPAPKGISNANN